MPRATAAVKATAPINPNQPGQLRATTSPSQRVYCLELLFSKTISLPLQVAMHPKRIGEKGKKKVRAWDPREESHTANHRHRLDPSTATTMPLPATLPLPLPADQSIANQKHPSFGGLRYSSTYGTGRRRFLPPSAPRPAAGPGRRAEGKQPETNSARDLLDEHGNGVATN